jgi:hypothetical protein
MKALVVLAMGVLFTLPQPASALTCPSERPWAPDLLLACARSAGVEPATSHGILHVSGYVGYLNYDEKTGDVNRPGFYFYRQEGSAVVPYFVTGIRHNDGRAFSYIGLASSEPEPQAYRVTKDPELPATFFEQDGKSIHAVAQAPAGLPLQAPEVWRLTPDLGENYRRAFNPLAGAIRRGAIKGFRAKLDLWGSEPEISRDRVQEIRQLMATVNQCYCGGPDPEMRGSMGWIRDTMFARYPWLKAEEAASEPARGSPSSTWLRSLLRR